MARPRATYVKLITVSGQGNAGRQTPVFSQFRCGGFGLTHEAGCGRVSPPAHLGPKVFWLYSRTILNNPEQVRLRGRALIVRPCTQVAGCPCQTASSPRTERTLLQPSTHRTILKKLDCQAVHSSDRLPMADCQPSSPRSERIPAPAPRGLPQRPSPP